MVRAAGFYLIAMYLAAAARSAEPETTARFRGHPENWECRSVELDSANAIGFMSYPAPRTEGAGEDTAIVRVLYRDGRGGRSSIRLRLPAEEARMLGGEIASLLRHERRRPIRFLARVGAGGVCEIDRVTG
jgi:hypothetical protein